LVDERIKKLAHNLVNYSCRVKKGEKVLIDTSCTDDMVVEELIRAVYDAGGLPYVDASRPAVSRELLNQITEQQVRDMTEWDSARMRCMQAYIAIRGSENAVESVDVPQDKKDMWQMIYSKQVHHDLRVKNTKWVVLRYPTPSMAQMAGMSTRAFEDFYFDVCNLDYAKMNKAMDALVARFDRTDKVRLLARDTDISFSVKGIPAIKCAGHMNIPDGEVYTAPVLDSANGKITFNTPSLTQGFKFENVSLVMKDGVIIEESANDAERLKKILDTDEGARRIGEFSLGLNPYITKPMTDILFDEKIAGSIHFTPGNAYDDADNGNRSAVHWDMVLIQTPEFGGGEIWFDGELIRKDGRFVAPDLKGLNPENLK
jgi:aminopeptidase